MSVLHEVKEEVTRIQLAKGNEEMEEQNYTAKFRSMVNKVHLRGAFSYSRKIELHQSELIHDQIDRYLKM